MGADRKTPPEVTAAAEEVRAAKTLAVCWADFTKALAIYPETNGRVQQHIVEFLAAHHRALEEAPRGEDGIAQEGVAILFRGDRLVLGDDEEDLAEGSNLAWLRDRLDRGALAGVEFLPRLEAPTLIAFSKHLLATYLRKGTELSFEALWPETYAGLYLVDRRFEGTFGGRQQEGERYRGGHASHGSMGAGEMDLIKVLLADEGIAAQVATLQAKVEETEPEATAHIKAPELLDRIVRNLPADAMKDRATLVEAMREVLHALQERIFQQKLADGFSELQNDMTLSTLLYSVSRAHFARQGPDMTRWTLDELFPDAVQAKGKLGHVGDDRVHEDVDALLEELDALPPELAVDLSPEQAESRSEQLAVLLHYLVCSPAPTEIEGLYPSLSRLLATSGPAEEGVLRDYLLQYGGGLENRADAGEVPALLAFLQSTGNTALLRSCGVFEPDWIVRVFPQYFTLYLKALDPRSQGDLQELNDVCEKIGFDAMLAAEAPLLAGGRGLDLAQVQQLLLQPDRSRLALTRHMLQWHGPDLIPEVALYLRRLDPAGEETFLLYQLPDFEFLTLEYLSCVIDQLLGKPVDPRRMRRGISDVLCRHVRGTREKDPRGRARMESIRNLVKYPSANGWYLLRELGRGAWLPFLAKEPAVIRRLARTLNRSNKAA